MEQMQEARTDGKATSVSEVTREGLGWTLSTWQRNYLCLNRESVDRKSPVVIALPAAASLQPRESGCPGGNSEAGVSPLPLPPAWGASTPTTLPALLPGLPHVYPEDAPASGGGREHVPALPPSWPTALEAPSSFRNYLTHQSLPLHSLHPGLKLSHFKFRGVWTTLLEELRRASDEGVRRPGFGELTGQGV